MKVINYQKRKENNMKTLIKNEMTGWKKIEILWLLIATATILSLSLYWNDSIMGIISALTGVWCVICTGKGKLSAYVFGLVNCVLYAIISFEAKYYGETMLNAIYYVPMQFVGFFTWIKYMNPETHEVVKKNMSHITRVFSAIAVFFGVIVYGFILQMLGGELPYIDAFTTVMSVAAMIISVRMYAEQWILWIIIDVFTVYLWAVNFVNGTESISTLIMWVLYLMNAIFMFIKWNKEAKTNEV